MKVDDKVNILLVDDQPAKLLTYESILGSLDQNLVKASSGEEALQQLLKREFAIVLLDVCMPNIDGFELAKMISEHPRCRRTAIIFISAVQMTNLDQMKGYEYGAVDYISVPVVPEVLRARVSVFADLYRKTTALQNMNRELEARVAERTAELERDLAERKRLEEALLETDRRKDEFLAVLSHELRNPLAPIRTAIDIMRLKPVHDPLLLECRDIIGRQAEQLTRLVDDLLDISRITHGSFALMREPADIAEIIRRAVETQQPLIQARGHTLTVEVPDEPVIVDGDVVRLSEAIANILGNAAKYTDQAGQIELRVESGKSAEGDREVRIRVKDNGLGIPTDMLGNIFEAFTQVDRSLQRSQGGLGIGLALVRKVAELHSGSIEAHSEGLGRGSEFVLRLPMSRAARPARGAADRVVPFISSRRVLVVDDNRAAADTLAAMLRLDLAEVEVARDALQGLKLAERFRPEAILLDLGLPGMSGLEMAKMIRAQPWGADIVLIAQTGWGQEKDREATRAAGFDAHLTKPIDRATLLRVLGTRHPVPAPEAGVRTPLPAM